ncbi:putative hatpase_c domain [Diplodia seriata]|uniref:Putative hatpase_c domain n=1 Tax=Diplodia seriata TaxID=420778 RepID=A0A0G2H016_9PEZI|nr:putative hatpase_c domain [Diplodia seriata]
MAGAANYARMRELTMQEGQDDTVTVNTRALIDKVLARYSAEFTTLRELVQNAADAGATKATIRLETDPSTRVPLPQTQDPAVLLRHVVKNHTLRSLDVANNGKPFADADWSRLRCIAEGNPDETKIGAFGVGFYSVFSECDEPFVISGNRTMAFFWKGNTLAVKSGTLPAEQASDSTRFILDYRKSSDKNGDVTPSPVPDLFELSKFFTTSLTFLALQSIELFVDNFKILQLTKTTSAAAPVSIPSHIGTKSEKGLMEIREVTHQMANIKAEWTNVIAWDRKESTQEVVAEEAAPAVPSLKGFFARFNIGTASKREQEQKAAREKATIALRINTVNINTKVPKVLSSELLRATKKPPPQQTRLAILTADQSNPATSITDTSGLTVDRASDLFASALPTKHGRVFIGFPTGQTTGYQCHIFAPSLIPTVERESIDLSNRHVSTWNEAMLEIAGIACRMAFDSGMATVKENLAKELASAGASKPTGDHISKVVPDTMRLLKQWTSEEATPSAVVGKRVEIGFWNASKKAEMLSTNGVLPCQSVRVSMLKLGFLQDLPMVPEQLIEANKAFIEKMLVKRILYYLTVEDIVQRLENKPLNEEEMREFLKFTADMTNSDTIDAADLKKLFNAAVLTDGQTIIALGSITFYLNAAKYPPDLPFPDSVMPLRYTKDFTRVQLEGFGWTELPVEEWIRYLLEFNQRNGGKSLTKDAEFATQVLKVISKQWDQLRAHQRNEVVALLQPHTVMPTKSGMQTPQQTYHPNVKLFEDLPNLIVPGLKPKFLEALGLRQTIDLDYVFTRLLATPNKTAQDNRPKWSHMDLIEYLADVRDSIPAKDRTVLAEKQIWPVEEYAGFRGDPKRLYKLQQIYEPGSDNKALGLPVIKWRSNTEYRSQDPKAKFLRELGLRKSPSWNEVVDMMLDSAKINDAQQYEKAMHYFLSNRALWQSIPAAALSDKKILPVEASPFPSLVRPSEVYAKLHKNLVVPRSSHCKEFGNILNFVDFGSIANAFLKTVGAKDQPTIQELARMVVENPSKVLQELQAPKYMDLLRQFAVEEKELKSDKHLWAAFKARPVLLAFKDEQQDSKPAEDKEKSLLDDIDDDTDEIDDPSIQQVLVSASASQIVVRDNVQYYGVFRHSLLVAPEDEVLEQFYMHLGAEKLSDRVNVEKIAGNPIPGGEHKAAALKTLLVERTPIFLISYSKDQIFHDARWLETNLDVKLVSSLTHRLQLPGQRAVSLKTSAGLLRVKSRFQTATILYVRPDFDFYEVSRELVPILLKRQNPKHEALILETILSNSLRRLRDKGYDVHRILARKERHRALEQARLAEEEKNRIANAPPPYADPTSPKQSLPPVQQPPQIEAAANEAPPPRTPEKSMPRMPGAFGSPEHDAPPDNQLQRRPSVDGAAANNNRRNKFMSNFTKAFENLTTGNNSNRSSIAGPADGGAGSSGGGSGGQPPPRPSDPNHMSTDIRANLDTALQKCRAHNSPHVQSEARTRDIDEARGSYCDSSTSKDLTRWLPEARPGTGIAVFLANNKPAPTADPAFLAGLDAFAAVIARIGGAVFGFSKDSAPGVLNIFYEETSSTIAFNQGGALFFNYHYFLTLHRAALDRGDADGRRDAHVFWWEAFCHEIAHNLAQEHSAQHVFYEGSFVKATFAGMSRLVGGL